MTLVLLTVTSLYEYDYNVRSLCALTDSVCDIRIMIVDYQEDNRLYCRVEAPVDTCSR